MRGDKQSVNAVSTQGKDVEPWYLARRNRGALLRRLLVLILLLDLAPMVVFARNISGDIVNGFYWAYPGLTLFPFPLDLGSNLPVTAPLNPVDALVYMFFISNGIWMAWTAIALAYTFYPLFRRLVSRKS